MKVFHILMVFESMFDRIFDGLHGRILFVNKALFSEHRKALYFSQFTQRVKGVFVHSIISIRYAIMMICHPNIIFRHVDFVLIAVLVSSHLCVLHMCSTRRKSSYFLICRIVDFN